MNKIFSPLKRDVKEIYTWGLADPWTLGEVANWLSKQNFLLVVGYSPQYMDLNKLRKNIEEWKNYCPHMYVGYSRNLHIKAWVKNKSIWIGSCNLVNNTHCNIMVRITGKRVLEIRKQLFQQYTPFNLTTNLEIATTKKRFTPIISESLVLE